jgi:TrmH family RNA methyltransferase
MMISSRNNPAIKQIRSLRQRREREARGLYFIEGIRLVVEAVQSGMQIEQLVVAPDLLVSPVACELVQQQQRAGVPVLDVTVDVFETLSLKDGPQGLGAVLRQRWEALDEVRLGDELCWVALHAVADPGNLGTILRTADAVGAAGVLLLGNCTDPYDPAALRASMGAIFAQRLVRATWEQFAAWKQQHGYTVVGTSDAATTNYQALHYSSPLVLLMGSERQGLSSEQQAACDAVVSIPMLGRSDSLNLAVATGVMLYEILNQNRDAW